MKFYTQKNSTLLNILGVVLYKAVLDYTYIYQINPVYYYSGFTLNFNIKIFVLNWFVSLLSIFVVLKLYKGRDLFFSGVITLLYFLFFIPGLSYMAFVPHEHQFIIDFMLYWTVLLLVSIGAKNLIIKFPLIKNAKIFIYIILLILIISVLYVNIKYAGFRIFLKLEGEYELRMMARTYNLPTILNYILPTAGILLPLLSIYFFQKGRYVLTLLIFLIIILNYSIAGHKTVIFSLFLAIIGMFFYKKELLQTFSWGLNLVLIISLLEEVIFGTINLTANITRRIMYVPAMLNTWYYDFFTTHTPDYYKQSFLRYFGLTSDYNQAIALIIGEAFAKKEGTNANNGLMSAALQNFGNIGMFIHPLILILVLKFISSCAYKLDYKMLFLPIIFTTFMIGSGTLPVALLTNGLLALSILMLILSKQSN